MSVKRYEMDRTEIDDNQYSWWMGESDFGEYVLYSDYMELEEEIVQRQDTEDSLTKWVDSLGIELDELKEALLQIKEYANGQNWKSIVNMVDKIITKENK